MALRILPGLLLASLAWGSEYRVGPGDTLDVRIYDEPELSGNVVVSESCSITLALVKRLEVCGLTPPEVEERIIDAYSGDFLLNPSVSVKVTEYQSQRVDILGAVERPGPQYLHGQTSLLEAISLAGGPTAENVVQVEIVGRDGGARLFTLQQLSSGMEAFVSPGDKVFLKPGEIVFVEGQVDQPGVVSLLEGLTVTQAIALAGGTDEFANVRRVMVRRANGEKQRVNIVRVNRGLEDDPVLGANDRLIVPRSVF